MTTDEQPPAEPDAQMQHAKRRVLSLSATFFFIFLGAGAQQLYIAPYLQDCTNWSGIMRAFVPATVYAAMMIFRCGNVYLLRHWTNWRLTFVGSLTYTAFTLVMLATFWLKIYPLAIIGAIVWGWGAAAMWTGSAMQILAATDAGKRYGIGTGTLYTGTHAGWLTGVIVLGVIYRTQALPPYALYIAAAALTAIGNICAWLQPRDRDFVTRRPTINELLDIGRRAKARIAGFLMFASALSFGLMLGVFGDYVKQVHGAEYIWITAMFYPATRMILSFAGGALADRVGHGFLLAAGFVLASIGMLATAHWQVVASAALAALALGLLSSVVPVVATTMVGDSADRKRRPLAYGALFMWRDFGVFLAAAWGKALMDKGGGFADTFQTFAVAFIACGAVSLLLQRYAREKL